MKRSSPILIAYCPHGLNPNNYFPIDLDHEKYNEFQAFKKDILKKDYDFVLFFNSRNIRRKQIPDAMLAFRLFLDKVSDLKGKEAADRCCLLLHTELISDAGTDLIAVKNYLYDKYPNSIIINQQAYSIEQMNYIYNSTDAQILLTDNEGWGLSLTEAILVGNPIIANCQGGMQDQMRFEDEKGNWINFTKDFPSNHRGTYKKHGVWSFPVYPSNISIQGSPQTPYISSDRCRPEDAADQIFNVYTLDKNQRKKIGLEGRKWACSEEAGFTSLKQAERVIEAFDELFATWKPREPFELINAIQHSPDVTRDHKLIY